MVTFSDHPRILTALSGARRRVELWDSNSELRVKDLKAYLTWQMEALSNEPAWYFDDPGRKQGGEYDGVGMEFREMLDRRCHEIKGHHGRMLRLGRFDYFDDDEKEEVEEKDGKIDVYQMRKRRCVDM